MGRIYRNSYSGSKLVLIIDVLLFCTCVVACHTINVPTMVTRRLTDIYQCVASNSHISCDDVNVTFLVSDGRCIKNQELINACSFSISPVMERSTFRVALTFGRLQNSTVVEHAAETSMSDNTSLTTAIVVTTDGINLPVNGSLCQIESLEVYRGRRSTTKISHEGFSISNEGIFMINPNNLAYNRDEYKGELYRMNISCTTTKGLPRSGCLFFKVTGTTQVKNAKFNFTVQGTKTQTTVTRDNSSNTESDHPPLANENITTAGPITTVTTELDKKPVNIMTAGPITTTELDKKIS